MQKITTCIWFDNNKAEEAVDFYASLFKNSKIGDGQRYGEKAAQVSGRPVGSVMTVEFELDGSSFLALNGGPEFPPNPSISFFVNCKTEEEVEQLYKKLSDGGSDLMPLNKYEFADKYAWLNDKFGNSWQLFNAKDRVSYQRISNCLMFANEKNGRAEEAIKFYTSKFENSKVIFMEKWKAGEPGPEGTVKHARFALDGVEFVAMDAPGEHPFSLPGAVSFIANCKDQKEVDKFWDGLTEGGGQPIECGWLMDRFGVAWQVTPTILPELLKTEDEETREHVFEAMIKMKKIDIETLKRAASGPATSKSK